jgi:hypothetical protein
MKQKVFILLLILSSLIGYLEWGGKNSTFLFEAEAEVFSLLMTEPLVAIHPLTLFPIAGQLILLISLFKKLPSRFWILVAIASLALLLGFMFVIGLISFKYKILLSTLPFFLFAFLTIRSFKKVKTG